MYVSDVTELLAVTVIVHYSHANKASIVLDRSHSSNSSRR